MAKYAYCRVSTDAQGESGVSLKAQDTITQKIGLRIDDVWGDARFPERIERPGYFVDVHSAYRCGFFERPAGKKLLDVLDDGDTIIMQRLDRGFRSVGDFCNFIAKAKKYNWNLVCADPPIDLSTPSGILFAHCMAAMAQWESAIKGQRIREALAAKKRYAEGKPVAPPSIDVSENAPSEYRKPEKPKVMQSETSVEPGRVFVYIRCSHRSSLESGLGLRHQMDTCCSYADELVQQYPQLTFNDTVVTDPAISAWKQPVFERTYGAELNRQLRKGDTVVCLRPDRVFCSISDMSDTLREWDSRGVKVHFAEGGLNLDSEFGRMILAVLVAFAEMERKLTSNRAKECREETESQGKFAGGYGYPPFWMGAKINSKRCLVLDRRQLVSFRLIRFLMRDKFIETPEGQVKIKGLLIGAALNRVESLIAKREGRPEIKQHGVPRKGVWASLPDYYVPNKNGLIYPLWTRKRYLIAKPLFEAAMSQWREKQVEEKSALAALAKADGFHRPINRHKRKKVWSVKKW